MYTPFAAAPSAQDSAMQAVLQPLSYAAYTGETRAAAARMRERLSRRPVARAGWLARSLPFSGADAPYEAQRTRAGMPQG